MPILTKKKSTTVSKLIQVSQQQPLHPLTMLRLVLALTEVRIPETELTISSLPNYQLQPEKKNSNLNYVSVVQCVRNDFKDILP